MSLANSARERPTSPPLPLLLVESRSCRRVEKLVIVALAHRAGSVSPASARAASCQHDKASRLRVQLDFFPELRLLQQHFWNPYAPGIIDADDAGLSGHVI